MYVSVFMYVYFCFKFFFLKKNLQGDRVLAFIEKHKKDVKIEPPKPKVEKLTPEEESTVGG